MLVVIDEHFGVSSLPDSNLAIVLKPAKVFLRRQQVPLQAAIEETPPGFFAKTIRLKPYTLEEEIGFFKRFAGRTEQLLYMYDPAVYDSELLLRLRNWLLPELQLLPIPMTGNRAWLYCLTQTVTRLIRSGRRLTYQQIVTYIQQLQSLQTQWILSPDATLFVFGNKCNAVYKPPTKPTFKLMQIPPGGKPALLRAGRLSELWDYVIQANSKSEKIWAIQKGTDDRLAGADYLLQLPATSFPVHIPYVQALFLPITSIPV
jgi:hypothetical protein